MNNGRKWPPQAQHGPSQRPTQAHKPNVAQPKAATLQAKPTPVTPPVYRPQPTPKVLQRKTALPAGPSPKPPRQKPPAPPAYRPQPTPKCLQPKAAVPQPPTATRSEPLPDRRLSHAPGIARGVQAGGSRQRLAAGQPPRQPLRLPPALRLSTQRTVQPKSGVTAQPRTMSAGPRLNQNSAVQLLINPGFVEPGVYSARVLYEAADTFYRRVVEPELAIATGTGHRQDELRDAKQHFLSARSALAFTNGGPESTRFNDITRPVFNNLVNTLNALVAEINTALGMRDDDARQRLDDYMLVHNQLGGATPEQNWRLARQQREGTKVWLGDQGHRNQVRGFRSQNEADLTLTNLRNALRNNGVLDATVAIRGSAVRGWNRDLTREYRQGTGDTENVNNSSDLDFFFTSPSLEQKITGLGVRQHRDLYRPAGNLHPDDFNALLANDEANLAALGVNTNGLRIALEAFSVTTKNLIGRKADVTLIKESSLAGFATDDHVLVTM